MQRLAAPSNLHEESFEKYSPIHRTFFYIGFCINCSAFLDLSPPFFSHSIRLPVRRDSKAPGISFFFQRSTRPFAPCFLTRRTAVVKSNSDRKTTPFGKDGVKLKLCGVWGKGLTVPMSVPKVNGYVQQCST